MKRIFLLMAVALTTLSLSAQEKFKPYGFIQLQGGVGTTFTNADQGKLLSPTFTVGVGAMAIPELGLRLNVNGWQAKGGFASIEDKYKYNYINADVDVILNLCNLFSKRYNHLVDVSLLAGIGINHAWNNNIGELPLGCVQENISNIWGKDLKQTVYSGTSFRMGMMVDFRLSKHWQLGLEADMNAMGDDWNAKFKNNERDWMLTGQLSLTYRFGMSKKQKKAAEPAFVEPAPKPAPVTTMRDYDTQGKGVAMPQAKPKSVSAETTSVPLNESLQYTLRETDVNNTIVIEKVAAWAKAHPNGKIQVKGYADKKTGSPTINMRYSKQRADKVAAALKAKGVPDSQLVITAYGDTVQPFSQNDQNRCVIILGE